MLAFLALAEEEVYDTSCGALLLLMVCWTLRDRRAVMPTLRIVLGKLNTHVDCLVLGS